MVSETVLVLAVHPGTTRHAGLVVMMSRQPLAGQWYDDAESGVDADTARTSFMVTFVVGPDLDAVPAAWAGWRFDVAADGLPVLRCCDNYVRRGYRGRTPELYRLAYEARHSLVVDTCGLRAETYLYPEPIPLHIADGWELDVSEDASGKSSPYPGGPVHEWQRLVRRPS
jgi:hypothetical protein